MSDTARLIIMFIVEIVAFLVPYLAYLKYDPDYKEVNFLDKKGYYFLFTEFFLSVLMFLNFKGNLITSIFTAVGCGYLLTSSVLDYQTTSVPDVLHYFSVLMFIPAILVNFKAGTVYSYIGIIGFALFVLLQLLVFSRTFGFSDALAFIAFGTLCFSQNKGWESMMGGMIIAYVLLIIIQLCKKNITRKLKLKKPVAFIPYIFAAYAVTLFIL